MRTLIFWLYVTLPIFCGFILAWEVDYLPIRVFGAVVCLFSLIVSLTCRVSLFNEKPTDTPQN